MNHDELEGKLDRAKGEVKQAVGHATNDQRLHDEGVVDEASGKIQEGFGEGRRKVGEAVEDLADRIKR